MTQKSGISLSDENRSVDGSWAPETRATGDIGETFDEFAWVGSKLPSSVRFSVLSERRQSDESSGPLAVEMVSSPRRRRDIQWSADLTY